MGFQDGFQQQKSEGVLEKWGHGGSRKPHQESDKEANNTNMFTLLNGISAQHLFQSQLKSNDKEESKVEASGFILVISQFHTSMQTFVTSLFAEAPLKMALWHCPVPQQFFM